jgi:site-specific recombinase XerD
MRAAGDRPHSQRMRALTVILWQAGLRIHEAPELTGGDLDEARGALLVRRGKGRSPFLPEMRRISMSRSLTSRRERTPSRPGGRATGSEPGACALCT